MASQSKCLLGYSSHDRLLCFCLTGLIPSEGRSLEKVSTRIEPVQLGSKDS